MKKNVISLSSVVAFALFAAYGFSNKEITNNGCNSQMESNNTKLADLGINGGINVDYKTGLVTEFVASNAGLNLFYMVQGGNTRRNGQRMYSRTITEQTLESAELIGDLIENYPASWIKDYRSVDIEFSMDDKKILLSSPNDTLTQEQKKALRSLKTTSGVAIKVNYNKKNYNDKLEKRQMNVSMVVTPEVEAEYEGGYAAMINYLKVNSQDEIAAKNFTLLPQPTINFVVNEDGLTENIKLINTSRDKEIDRLLVKLIKEMPKWEPAKNANGENVKQEFVFNVGQNGC